MVIKLYNLFMEIYIEAFLIQNILINFCLLKLVHLTTKSKTTFLKLLTSSIFGAIPSVFIVLFLNNMLILNLSKLITSLLMITTAFQSTKKQLIYNIVLLFLYTYALGGIITSISSSVYYTPFGAVMTSKFNLETICLITIIATYIFELVVKHLKLKIQTNNLIYNIKLTQSNKTISINAYMDTGNFLNLNGQPVLILDINAYLKLTNSNLINFYITKMVEIKTGTVNGTKNLKTCKIDKIEIKNGKSVITYSNQIIAINTTNCFKNTNYQALLSPLFL